MPQTIGSYRVLKRLGVGGMGEVFLCELPGAGVVKPVAVKRLSPALTAEPELVRLFLAEADLARRLDHPNVVRVYETGTAQGLQYIAMEYVDGPSLRFLIRQAREAGLQVEWPIAARLVASVSDALAYAHLLRDEEGRPLQIVHRDVTPENILVSNSGRPKLADFGIASAVGHANRTGSGEVRGKLSYMAPEQFGTGTVDHRADIWSAGVLLFELLAGRHPFDAVSQAHLLQQILYEPIPDIGQVRPDLPAALIAAIRRALVRDREARFETCIQFRMELERALAETNESVGMFRVATWLKAASGDPTAALPSRSTSALLGTPPGPGRSPAPPASTADQPTALLTPPAQRTHSQAETGLVPAQLQPVPPHPQDPAAADAREQSAPAPSLPPAVDVKGQSFISFLSVLERLRGKDAVDQVIAKLPPDLAALLRRRAILTSGWYSMRWYAVLHEAARDVCGAGISANIGHEATVLEVNTVFRFILKAFTPSLLVGLARRMLAAYSSGGSITVDRLGPTHKRLIVTGLHGSSAGTWQEFEAATATFLKFSGAGQVQLTAVSGAQDGDPDAVFDVSWSEGA